ncbi:galactosylceramide sulfotransferase [Branchiostoma belcheri]|nr:galactosylceramide sulfotransferase [Branchiostoma belcheri]
MATLRLTALYVSCLAVVLYVGMLWSWKDTKFTVKQSYSDSHGENRSGAGTVALYTGHRTVARSDVSTRASINQARCNRPVTNFVFIKVIMNCRVFVGVGTTTTEGVVFKRMEVVKRVADRLARIDRSACRPALGRNYTLLINHAIMNKTAMDRLMAPGTRYIGIVRHPLEHFRSMFFYRRSPAEDKSNPLGKYLDNRVDYQPGNRRRQKTISKQKNFQAYTLGFPTKLMASKSTSQINEALRTVADWYSIVLITDYWEESLVLLRRTFCWTMYDILHTTKRIHVQRDPKKSVPLTDKQKETHRTLSPIDYIIYEHFNRTFWDRVAKEGPGFWDEVASFKKLNLEVNHHCRKTRKTKRQRVFPGDKWSQEFAVNSTFCKELNWSTAKWSSALLRQLDGHNKEIEMNHK